MGRRRRQLKTVHRCIYGALAFADEHRHLAFNPAHEVEPLSPEELVALAAGYEAGLGEAVGAGGCGHERLTSKSFEYRSIEYSTI